MNTKQTTTNNNDWAKRDVGALWKREGKTGKYLSGYFKDELGEQVEIIVFTNKYKGENPKAPDFRIYISKDKNSTVATTSTKAANVVKEQGVSKKTSKPTEEVEAEEELL